MLEKFFAIPGGPPGLLVSEGECYSSYYKGYNGFVKATFPESRNK